MAYRRKAAAFTRRELVVVIVVLVALTFLLVPALRRASQKSKILDCNNNLKQIGIAYRIWSNDHGDHFPAFTPQTNGGWSDLLYRTNASAYAWTNYVTMADELGQSPMILICPADERKPAKTFSDLVANTNISYFVGVTVNDTYPQSPLGGDRNLGPGTTPDTEYGFSPANGKGNDVIITGPVCWSLKMHSAGNPAGAGNILLGDGSAQQTISGGLYTPGGVSTSGSLYEYWVINALAEKAAHDKTTNLAGLRLIFP
jgi:hypothetical protein